MSETIDVVLIVAWIIASIAMMAAFISNAWPRR